MDGWMDGWMDEWMSLERQQEFQPVLDVVKTKQRDNDNDN